MYVPFLLEHGAAHNSAQVTIKCANTQQHEERWMQDNKYTEQ